MRNWHVFLDLWDVLRVEGVMSGDMTNEHLMEGLMRAHSWRFSLKVGDGIDVQVESTWKEARVSRVDGDRVQVRGVKAPSLRATAPV